LSNNPNQLVDCFVEISANKERSTLEHSVVKTLSQLLVCESYLLQLHDGRADFCPKFRFWQPDPNTPISEQKKPLLENLAIDPVVHNYLHELESRPPTELYLQQGKVFWPLYLGEICLDILVAERNELTEAELGLLKAIGAIFTNFMGLLDAGERDALTGLLNRRVFDTRLDALVRNSSMLHKETGERRQGSREAVGFLGIIDIDYFKRVNDVFGHLFGDEVLLWLAQQMRDCFRNEDALFRYGGEEFAVLLVGLNQQQAQETFERFRAAIATTAFPQIDQITVSIGYTNIDAQANPTVVFGEADKALYYAKEHGRNRVECFVQLIKDKRLKSDREKEDIELF
jgi:diguanylate cyclase (GGDEF)-like protein